MSMPKTFYRTYVPSYAKPRYYFNWVDLVWIRAASTDTHFPIALYTPATSPYVRRSLTGFL